MSSCYSSPPNPSLKSIPQRMPLNTPPGPAVKKLSAAVESIENLEAWKASFEALMCKAQKLLCIKIEILDETVKAQAERISYLEEILEIEGVEEMGCIDEDAGAIAGTEDSDGR